MNFHTLLRLPQRPYTPPQHQGPHIPHHIVQEPKDRFKAPTGATASSGA